MRDYPIGDDECLAEIVQRLVTSSLSEKDISEPLICGPKVSLRSQVMGRHSGDLLDNREALLIRRKRFVGPVQYP
jgi:hypothetical protein